MLTFKTLSTLIFSGLATGMAFSTAYAQAPAKADDPLMKIYRATPPKINDLVHTKLDVRFDYKKCFMYGKEWVTLRPHFYPTDTLRLDAKGMDLNNISVVRNGKNYPLKFKYDDSLTVAIQLDKVYHNNETYTIYIDYTAKPNQLKTKGSAAINDAKGLYFINPDGAVKDKPVQIWTQGETESSSAWFPTIDKPEQKTTDEIIMTVPAKYVTLSNGRLAAQKLNGDGTRTDDWKMELPHSPYLFMMAVGDFKIYHDHWRNKEVNYYLEPKYAPYAKQIFGMTPELIEFYSKTLDYPFAWNKYSQIVVRDYVSGAMENTSATLHGDYVQETPRELLDANYDAGRSTIAHELFHQWFGDLVTAESWSNLTVNESFADFSEMLWAEHKYGKDEADAHSYTALQNYLGSPDASTKDLVRFHYDDKEDVFDVVTYQKGGRILNMLRNYLGDAAFFKGLNIYLKTNQFKNGEAQQLRLAEEEASGLDLNWFFNQWYYGAGHPVLNISYKWDEGSKTETVYLQQTQEGQIFKLPFAVDIYAGGKKERHKVWMNDKADTLTFTVASKPNLVNVDGDKVLLCAKTDNKSLEEFEFQYFNAPLYLDRFEAINAVSGRQSDKGAQKVLIAALKDKYYGLRIKAIRALNMSNDDIHNAALPVLTTLAQTDDNTLVRAAAISALGKLKASGNMNLFKQALSSQSYAVQGAALTAINLLDPKQALPLAKGFEQDNKGPLTQAIITVYSTSGGSDEWPYVLKAFNEQGPQGKFGMARNFAAMTGHVDNPTYAQQGIAAFKDLGIKYKKFGVAPFVTGLLADIKAQRVKLKDDASAKAADDATQAINDAK
ncbi:M1 family metallopeptidase [Mucilaginibacter gotjawali]|uniref:Aminopeptidase N n=2 Tax=Mucilaginibacter gotjawali TaxID=1550579 RepID=A0A839SLA0_9SPHI|nr:M1 family metallopeptidase [Mucilaginibacter gotjawali]MBB3058014.1 aminopeptidase N [Mucilaginibacter gotjawali]BAU51990.1 Aminopeptidase N [Mucilaginibacter gotjawali]